MLFTRDHKDFRECKCHGISSKVFGENMVANFHTQTLIQHYLKKNNNNHLMM